jgi:hypothetical protein
MDEPCQVPYIIGITAEATELMFKLADFVKSGNSGVTSWILCLIVDEHITFSKPLDIRSDRILDGSLRLFRSPLP